MIEGIKRILRFLPAIQKILTVLIDVIEDLADDGARNGSNTRATGKTSERQSG